ncbi:unnamed protein product [Rodentolepis nana]|uniref:Uncharacterized protein n=1 Tax=Rodentolepis nana TaxID=102285 RepID=A0A0R3TT69_RODNA|nr:unnamed protein product [Rodentolepis nana]
MESFGQLDWWSGYRKPIGSVGMYGLMNVFQAFGSLCLRLSPGEPCLGDSNVYLISAVPPPIERKFRPLTPIQTSRVFSVSGNANPPSPPSLPISSSNLPLDDLKFVETAAFVSDGALGNTQQYVLLSNSFHQPEGTAYVLSAEPSRRFCASSSEHAGV